MYKDPVRLNNLKINTPLKARSKGVFFYVLQGKRGLFLVVIGALLCSNGFAQEINIDDIIPCIIQAESGGDSNAYNKNSGAIGLMQITPIVLKEYRENYWRSDSTTPPNTIRIYKFFDPNYVNEGDLYNPTINVEIGTWYLKRIKNHFLPYYKIPVTLETILIAYNWGIGNLVKFNKKYSEQKLEDTIKYLPKETRNYIIKIKKCLNE